MACQLLALTTMLLTIQAKKYDRAIALIARHGWWDRMLALVRQLDKGTGSKHLVTCVAHFRCGRVHVCLP